MIQKKFKIISQKTVALRYYKLILEAPEIAREALPGQFLNIKVSDNHEPFLRRPFSIHRRIKNQIEILYEVVGRGTEILSQKKPEEYLDVIGPLGNGFAIKTKDQRPRRRRGSPKAASTIHILVAGGMGIAPLLFLAEKLAQLRSPISKLRTVILIGARTKNEIICEKEFKDLDYDVKIATDDGSRGFKGYVSDLLKKILRTPNSLPCRQAGELRTAIYACGPQPMLKEISQISKKYNIPAQVSLEEHMACGIGACFGCVIKVKSQKSKVKSNFEYQRVCKEGPVFEAQEIAW